MFRLEWKQSRRLLLCILCHEIIRIFPPPPTPQWCSERRKFGEFWKRRLQKKRWERSWKQREDDLWNRSGRSDQRSKWWPSLGWIYGWQGSKFPSVQGVDVGFPGCRGDVRRKTRAQRKQEWDRPETGIKWYPGGDHGAGGWGWAVVSTEVIADKGRTKTRDTEFRKVEYLKEVSLPPLLWTTLSGMGIWKGNMTQALGELRGNGATIICSYLNLKFLLFSCISLISPSRIFSSLKKTRCCHFCLNLSPLISVYTERHTCIYVLFIYTHICVCVYMYTDT